MAEINLPCGRVALLDDADLPLLRGYRLYANPRKNQVYVRCYREGQLKGPYVYLHHLLSGWLRVDHRDRNGLNNCRENLRQCSPQTNSYNTPKRSHGSNPYKGISFHRQTNRWVAQVTICGKHHSGGLHKTAEAAALAYDEMALKYHGEFAFLNFPDAHG